MNGFEIQCLPGSDASMMDVMAATSGTAFPEEWLFDALSGHWGRSDSGETVNPVTALTHGPVWAAVNKFAGDAGQLPLQVFKKDGRMRERVDSHPVDWLLTEEPNEYQTPSIWKETMLAWALLWGNGCSYIVRDGTGRPIALAPLMPDRTSPRVIEGEWWIETDFGDGRLIPLPYEDVFHIRGLATDGFWGLSAVQVCKNTIGGAMATKRHKNRTFKNGATLSGALEIPGAIPPPEKQREMRGQLDMVHAGSDNAGKWLLLFGGTKFAPYSMSNVDAQTLELMEWDVDDIARVFGIAPYLLGSMKNSAVRANLEQQNTDYFTNSLSRHLNKFREEGQRKLFSYQERRSRRFFLKWIVEAFLRGDLAARGAYYAQAKAGEWLTSNEIREKEDMNPIAGGDVLRNPAINPATPKSDPPAKRRDDPPPSNDAADYARELVVQQVAALIEAEAKAATRACNPETKANLVRWAENYYENYQKAASHFLEQPCKVASAIGCGPCDWRRAVCDHARDSLNRLLAMAGIVTPDRLLDIGREFSESVRDRKEQLTKTILGG